VFQSPPRALAPRSRAFGLSGRWSRVKLQALNKQLVTLSRVVLHPTYRGAGLAAAFVRASCRACPFPWIETLAEMGHINPFFERAGFVRIGVTGSHQASRTQHSALYGARRDRTGKPRLVSAETHAKSRHASPVYYLFDNRPVGSLAPVIGGEGASAPEDPPHPNPLPRSGGEGIERRGRASNK